MTRRSRSPSARTLPFARRTRDASMASALAFATPPAATTRARVSRQPQPPPSSASGARSPSASVARSSPRPPRRSYRPARAPPRRGRRQFRLPRRARRQPPRRRRRARPHRGGASDERRAGHGSPAEGSEEAPLPAPSPISPPPPSASTVSSTPRSSKTGKRRCGPPSARRLAGPETYRASPDADWETSSAQTISLCFVFSCFNDPRAPPSTDALLSLRLLTDGVAMGLRGDERITAEGLTLSVQDVREKLAAYADVVEASRISSPARAAPAR